MRTVCAWLVLMAAAAAPAAARVAGPALSLGSGADPRVTVAADGSATVAWARVEPGAPAGDPAPITTVLAAQRRAGERSFGPARTLAREAVVPGSLSLAGAAGGVRALAWLGDGRLSADGAAPLRVVRAEPGVAFGAPQSLAAPARLPVAGGNEAIGPASRRVFGLAVAVAGDGVVVASACEADSRAGTQRVLAWVGDQAQRLGSCRQSTFLGALAGGSIVALWAGTPDGGGPVTPIGVLSADRDPGGSGFGANRVLSDPGASADDGSYPPGLATGLGGDALAWWAGSPSAGGDPPGVVYRPRAMNWGPPTLFAASNLPVRSTMVGAVGAHGDAAVAWFSVAGTASWPRRWVGASRAPSPSPRAWSHRRRSPSTAGGRRSWSAGRSAAPRWSCARGPVPGARRSSSASRPTRARSQPTPVTTPCSC